MKKIFAKVAIVATVLVSGFTMTSCDGDEIGNAINTVLTLWQQLQSGTQVTFKGTSAAKKTTYANEKWTYNASDYTTGTTSTCSMSTSSSQASIVIDQAKAGNYTITGINISPVDFSTSGTTGTIGKDGYAYKASFTVAKDGETSKSYSTTTTTSGSIESAPYAMVTGNLTESGTLTLVVSLYVSDTEAYIIEYAGTKQETTTSN